MYLRAELGPQEMLDQDFVIVQGHDLQDVLYRIGMMASVKYFRRLLVRLNPLVDCRDPDFWAEVWGVEYRGQKASIRCLYRAGQKFESSSTGG